MPQIEIPTVFISYSHTDAAFVERIVGDMRSSGIESWVDDANLEAGDRLENIREAIRQSTLVLAYVTERYLASRWPMEELRIALDAPRVAVAAFVDSEETLAKLPDELRDEVSFGVLRDDSSYDRTLSQVARKAWTSLQVAERLVPASDHILASQTVFQTRGYSQQELFGKVNEELILAGANLRNWLTDRASRDSLLRLVKDGKKVTLILGTYESLEAISPEGATHLRASARELKEMRDALGEDERERLNIHFHIAVVTLSAVFVDPRSADGILFFSPRWAFQFVPHDRFSCAIDRRINSPDLFNAIYGGVTLMIQDDAKTLEEML
jgi:TIR domain